MSTRSRNAVLHRAGSLGMVTANVAVHTMPGASVSPGTDDRRAVRQRARTPVGGPLPGEPTATNGAVSVSNVTVAGKNRRS